MISTVDQQETLDELTRILKTRLVQTNVHDVAVVQSVSSTNTELMEQAYLDQPKPGSLLWALQQTAGRGRRGRVWQSDPENALTFSLGFEAEVREHSKISSLSPAVGLRLAKALSQMSPGIQVKWPNDLWRNGRKIAGILLEATHRGSTQRVVIGIGINLFWPSAQEQSSVGLPHASSSTPGQTPGGMFDHSPTSDMKIDILTACAKALDLLYQEMQDTTRANSNWFSDWTTYDALANQNVNLFQDSLLIASGFNAGVDVDGAFLLKSDFSQAAPSDEGHAHGAIQRFEIGEVSLRRAP
jgi:BirA family transcriptional regulator, biotin operon repressor / biotin---[acetyl-CoA-carboxylase] ligase